MKSTTTGKLYRRFAEDAPTEWDSYGDHVLAMTAEELDSKAEIAAELAYRDERIKELQDHLQRVVGLFGDYEPDPNSSGVTWSDKTLEALRGATGLLAKDD